MTKRNWLVTAIVVIIVLIVLAAGGYGLYRLGYVHGAQALSANGEVPRQFMDGPFSRHPGFGMREFGRGFVPMMPRVGRFGHFSWFGLIFRVAVIGVVIALLVWLIVYLARRSGTPVSLQSAPPPGIQPPEQNDQS